MMDCQISSHFCAQRRSKDELEQNIFKHSDFKTSAKISIAGTEEVIKIKMFRKLTSTSLEGTTQCSRACYVQHSTGNRIMRGELNNRVKENMVLYIMTSLIKLPEFAHCLYLHINSPSFPSRLAPGVTESSEACIFEKYNSSPLGNTWAVFFHLYYHFNHSQLQSPGLLYRRHHRWGIYSSADSSAGPYDRTALVSVTYTVV